MMSLFKLLIPASLLLPLIIFPCSVKGRLVFWRELLSFETTSVESDVVLDDAGEEDELFILGDDGEDDDEDDDEDPGDAMA